MSEEEIQSQQDIIPQTTNGDNVVSDEEHRTVSGVQEEGTGRPGCYARCSA